MKNCWFKIEGEIVLHIDGKPYTLNRTFINYGKIEKMLTWKRIRWHLIKKLLDTKRTVKAFCGKNVKFTENGRLVVTRKDATLDITPIATRIKQSIAENERQSLLNFLDNLLDNPQRSAVEELFLFLEANSLPLTQDGCFIAYKKVTHDFKDIHTRKFDNSVGQIVQMDRDDVDDDRSHTCSTGLHFCSKDYLSHFGDSTCNTIAVKVNPKDVVSIPNDYNNSKGRCCKYQVIAVVHDDCDDNQLKDLANRKTTTSKVLKKNTSTSAKVVSVPTFESVRACLKKLPKQKRYVGMNVMIVNTKGQNMYQFVGGVGYRNLIKVK